MTETPEDQVETPEGMTRVHIVRNFVLNRGRGHSQTKYTIDGTNCGLPGYYDMTEEDANHFYVRLNSDNPPETTPMPGTTAAREVIESEAEQRALDEAAVRREADRKTEQARRGKQKDMKEKLGDSFEQSP